MENKKLMEILTLVGNVESNRWNDVLKIVEIMPSIEVKDKKWNDEFKQKNISWYELDLSKTKTWSTYEGDCINLVFSNKSEKLICDVKIYDGDNVRGLRTNLRFTASLVMPDIFIKEIEQKILWALDRLAEESYNNYLEAQKKLWVLNFKSEILKK